MHILKTALERRIEGLHVQGTKKGGTPLKMLNAVRKESYSNIRLQIGLSRKVIVTKPTQIDRIWLR